jgi:hypothetical protein
MTPGTCIHYTGIGMAKREDTCRAGVNYHAAFDFSSIGVMLRIPCVQYRTLPAHGRGTYIKAGEPTVRQEIDRRGHEMIPCHLFREPTPEEVDADRKESDASIARTFAAISASASWRVRPKPDQDRAEVVECPVCKGRLHLFQSALNGHVHGKCETAGCVKWME